MARTTFAEAMQLLPEKKFVRVHRSFLVAVGKIDKVERHQVTLGRQRIPVSEAYSAQLQLRLNAMP